MIARTNVEAATRPLSPIRSISNGSELLVSPLLRERLPRGNCYLAYPRHTKPSVPSIDGIRLDLFKPGLQYDVGTTLATLFLAEGWGEPVVNEKPALAVPLDEILPAAPRSTPASLHRDTYPPPEDFAVAANFRRRIRRRREV